MHSSQLPALRSARLLDQVRERIRYLHYSIRTEEAYVHWVKAFIRFHDRRHPREMAGPEVEAFLSWLAAERGVAVSTHRQALSALLFLYSKVLGQEMPWMQSIGRPQRKPRLPVVLSADEVARVLALLDGERRLFAQLLYGTGLRITEGLQLREGHRHRVRSLQTVCRRASRRPNTATPCCSKLPDPRPRPAAAAPARPTRWLPSVRPTGR